MARESVLDNYDVTGVIGPAWQCWRCSRWSTTTCALRRVCHASGRCESDGD